MKAKSSVPSKPVVTYPALVGRILAELRNGKGIKQGELAKELGLSQSAYSRLESGDSVLNLSQLRNVAALLGTHPPKILQMADQYEAQLRLQGVDVISEKQDDTAAIVIGLGLLAALFLSK